MVRPGKVIAERFGHVAAQKDAAGVLDRTQHRERVFGADFEVFRRDEVRGFDRLGEIIGHDDLAVGVHALPRDRGAGQKRNLPLKLGLHGLGQRFAVGHKHRRRELVVLGLAQKVGRDPGGVRAAVGQHENLGRPGDHIDADLAKDLALGRRDIDVAGADDFIDGRHAFGAVGQRGDSLRAAGFDDAVDARHRRRGEDVRVHLAVGAGGGGHHNLLDAGDLRGDHVHQHRRRVGRRAARHIDAGPLDRGVLLAQQHAGGVGDDEVLVDLVLVEMPDVGGCHPQRLDEILPDGGEGFLDLGLGDKQVAELGAVKLLGVVAQCFVAPCAHVGDDGIDDRFNIGLGPDISVEDFLRRDRIKVENADHACSASFILSTRVKIWLCLNL